MTSFLEKQQMFKFSEKQVIVCAVNINVAHMYVHPLPRICTRPSYDNHIDSAYNYKKGHLNKDLFRNHVYK